MRFRNICVIAAVTAILALAGCSRKPAETAKPAEAETTAAPGILPKSPTGFYAIYMATNNIVLYGKVQKFDEDFMYLKDVHYIRTNVNPKTKEIQNTIIRRGSEWHKPDETMVSTEQLLFIEPVAQDSRVMALIRDLSPK